MRNCCKGTNKAPCVQVGGRFLIHLLLNALFSIPYATGQEPGLENAFTICSQNLEKFSLADQAVSKSGLNSRSRAKLLAKRFIKPGCDVIGLQELSNDFKDDAEQSLSYLTKIYERNYRKASKKVKLGKYLSSQPGLNLKTGLIVNEKVLKVENFELVDDVLLPRFHPNQRPRYHLRVPILLRFYLRQMPALKFSLFIIHLKSKHAGHKDPLKLLWEGYRTEMAQALRGIITSELLSGRSVIVAGDRNSDINSASNLVLRGLLSLDDFNYQISSNFPTRNREARLSGRMNGGNARCRILKNLEAYCTDYQMQSSPESGKILYSIVYTSDNIKSGSFKYKNTFSKIDDILLGKHFAADSYDWVIKTKGGVLILNNEEREPSDHQLVWGRVIASSKVKSITKISKG